MAKKSDEPVKSSQLENLPPWDLNTDAIKDEKEAKEAEELMTKWLDGLQKDLAELFSKNGIDTFELDFIHKGTKTPILLTKGNSYVIAKLALHAANETRKRVENELKL